MAVQQQMGSQSYYRIVETLRNALLESPSINL